MKDKRIMKYIPKSKLNSISMAWKDDDGYWISIRSGWIASRVDARATVIHADTIKELRYEIAGIIKEDVK